MDIPKPYRSGLSSSGGFWIALELDTALFGAIPESVVWQNKVLRKKTEFHVTLIHAEVRFREAFEVFFAKFVETYPITLLSFADDLRHVQRGEEETIVVRCKLSNLELLFRMIQKTAGVKLPLQPAHVTLYLLQSEKGIAINSTEEMESLERVHLPELSKALAAAVSKA